MWLGSSPRPSIWSHFSKMTDMPFHLHIFNIIHENRCACIQYTFKKSNTLYAIYLSGTIIHDHHMHNFRFRSSVAVAHDLGDSIIRPLISHIKGFDGKGN